MKLTIRVGLGLERENRVVFAKLRLLGYIPWNPYPGSPSSSMLVENTEFVGAGYLSLVVWIEIGQGHKELAVVLPVVVVVAAVVNVVELM